MDSAATTATPFAGPPPPGHRSLPAAITGFLSGDGRSADCYDDSWAAVPSADAPAVEIKGPERAPR